MTTLFFVGQIVTVAVTVLADYQAHADEQMTAQLTLPANTTSSTCTTYFVTFEYVFCWYVSLPLITRCY